ncbi:MAG TPA: hypothetical protein VGX23_14175 [Actinocrinis sp.]|nr:hypothetical protein [Actinocrinis sp.]
MTTTYDNWRDVPEHYRTRTQLADLDLPRVPVGDPVAWIETRNAIGRRDCFDLYDATTSEPSPATAKTLEAAAARRSAKNYCCQDCGARTDSPTTALRLPGKSVPCELCRTCLHIGHLRRAQSARALARIDVTARAAAWVSRDTAAVIEVTNHTPPPGESGRRKPPVALTVQAVTPTGQPLADLSIRLRNSRHALVPPGALDRDTAFAQLRTILAGRAPIAWHARDLDPITLALIPDPFAVDDLSDHWRRPAVRSLHDAVATWRGELHPHTGRLLAPSLRPGRADRMALLIRRMAADHHHASDTQLPTLDHPPTSTGETSR